MTIHICEQGSEEWHALRRGKVTASRIVDVCARTKTGWGASRKNYKAELVLERLTGKTAPFFTSQAMKEGQEKEPIARSEYELKRRCDVRQIGFVDHPIIPMAGASADGFVGEDGLVEIKCPIAATHLEYLEAGTVPSEYVKQIDWNFACNPGRVWCDFVSFHPDFPEAMQLFVVRTLRDAKRIAEAESIVRDFEHEVDIETRVLRKKYLKVAA
ncbi:lambda exonuclease family protein [Bradyrhizobium cenepequi]|uniref:lambda exonuclease family protein n=1 Tax=Bradyrhizobium cenepequi TaxID=2821403 RepID=UPI001CE2F5A5|nr:lambda exonuclease family protein [Bradyrhizobium cenepequi]MCA6108165.1 YqaJ viral recombinase family protein [Bradyrhizobium cenepequi]